MDRIDKKIRILHVLTDTNIGGAGTLLYNLKSAVNRQKYEFAFVFSKDSELIDLFRGERIYLLNNGADRSLDLKAALEIKRIIEIEKPDIIHTHSALFARIGARLARFDKRRVVYTKHCVFDVPKFTKYKLFRAIYRKIDDALSGSIVAVAESAKNELIMYGVREEKIKVIINGTLPLKESSESEKGELKRRLGISDCTISVGISARLESYKGHKTLIKAAKIIKEKGIDDIIFLILGRGSCEGELKTYAESLGVSDRTVFLGFQPNVAEYVNLFDINVNCSTGTETSSLAISEGLSLGKPVIASVFGGNPNMVKDGETGFLFPQGDAEALAEKIIFLKANPDTLKYMSNQAKLDFAERFSAERMAGEYGEFYKKIIK